MKVILTETVDALGRRGDIVEVANGYARNYLLPQGLALKSTEANERKVLAQRHAYLAREAKRIEDAQEIADAIAKLQFTVKMKAHDDGQLYGSLNERVVAQALEEEQITIEPKMVRIDEPIRELGRYKVTIRLHSEVDCEANIWVVEDAEASKEVAAESEN